MHSLRYRLTTRSPVVISTISGDVNMVATKKHIPGTLVLGLLAKRFIDKKNSGPTAHENEDFYNWFLAGRMKMSNAYLFSQNESGGKLYYPTPLSIEKEKYFGRIAYDRLLLEQEPDEQTKHKDEFCFLQTGVLRTRAVETGVNFHHARNREKGVSEEGLIFNYESIAAGQVFAGELHGESEDLQNLLQIFGSEWPAFVGRSKNSQYGTVAFEFIDQTPVPLQNQIAWPENEDRTLAEYISLTLLSDLILYNECGYPTTDVEDLRIALEKRLGPIKIEKAFAKKTEAENFVGVWRLKKPSETCFSAGSAFLLKVDPEKRGELAALQETGIGERIHEGFGRCVFGWQTHVDLTARDDAEEEAKRAASKPDGEAPKITKAIVQEIAQNAIRESIELKAVNQQRDFDRLPANALIARLHSMACSTKNRCDFVAAINQFRKIAADQLRDCVSRERNLLEYLAAFRLPERAIAELEKNGFDDGLLAAIKKLDRKRQFTLVADLTNAIGKKPDDPEKFQTDVLAHAEFCEDPVDWPEFFRQRRDVDIKSLCEVIKYEPEKDSQLKRDLTKSFYVTFFSMMRQRKIAKEEGRDVK